MIEDESRCFLFLHQVLPLRFSSFLCITKYVLNQDVLQFFINRSNKRLLDCQYQEKEI
jgi:hypothetical protein